MGMYHIAKAVSFLNTDCKLVSPAYCKVFLSSAESGGSHFLDALCDELLLLSS